MSQVKICDVTLRDGMQALNRDARIPVERRRLLAEALQRSRLPYIEAGSFVSPRVIASMRDTPELLARLSPYPGELAALVPNLDYYLQLSETQNVDTVAVFVSASEEYSRVNTRMSSAAALDSARQVAAAALADGYRLRAYLSYAFRRPHAGKGGEMPAGRVAEFCTEFRDMGCQTIALSDTDGRATPGDIERVLRYLADGPGLAGIGVHLHDRYGAGIANALIAYQIGVRTFDSSLGGIGGNHLLRNAVGNLATEELVYMFHGLGIDTGVDYDALLDAGRLLLEIIAEIDEPPPPSKVLADLVSPVAGGDS